MHDPGGSSPSADAARYPSIRVRVQIRAAEVDPEVRQLRSGDPEIDGQPAGPAEDDDRQPPEQLAPVDADPVRDRRQHAIPTGGCSCRA